jgi:polyphenol oxidase
MIKKEKEGLTWFEFELLQQFPEIGHAVVSRKNFVDENANFFSTFGINKDAQPTYANQVHKRAVSVVEEESPLFIDQCDGLLTSCKERPLCMKHADCQIAFFYDPVKKVIATVHCGWRGNVANIYSNTITTLTSHFGTNPSDLFVCISPSLGPSNAEFINYQTEFPKEFWQFQVRPNYFNLWELSRWQLESAHVPTSQIQIANICTFDKEEFFYSYRRDHQKERNLSLMWHAAH